MSGITQWKVGDRVRIKTMAKTNAIGYVHEIRANGSCIVRLPFWQADGYHLDVSTQQWELVAPNDEHLFDTNDDSRR